jgi:hypothetical protein
VLYGDAGAYPSFDWSARAAGHAATLAESRNTSAFLSREVDIQELLRTNDDSPWERIFQFRPFGVDVFGAYGGGATAILQQLTRNRSGQTSLTVGACGRLAFQSLRVALDREFEDVAIEESFSLSPLSLLPQLPGSESLRRD